MLTHRQLCLAVCASLLGLVVTQAANSAKPTPQLPPVPKIFGATPASPGDYSYFVSVNGCGGTLIAPEWVLTAEHCLDNAPVDSTVQPGWTRDAVSVGKVTTRVLAHYPAPPGWDLGLLKVEPVFIRPLPLAAITPAMPALVRGMGGGIGSPGGLGSAPFHLYDTDGVNWFAEGKTDDISTCGGDSGGPQVIDTAAGPRLVGVLFAGIGDCGPDDISVSINVTYTPVQEWITAVTGVTPGSEGVLTGIVSGQPSSAAMAGDSDWMTYWTAFAPGFASVMIDRTQSQAAVPVNTLTYLPRQDDRAGDAISYRIYVSRTEGDNIQVAEGTWPSSPDMKVANWPAVDMSRYVTLTILTTNGGLAEVAEIATSWTPPEYPIRRGGTAVAATSYESINPIADATDGSPGTFWHSRYTPSYSPLPQEITIQTNDPTTRLQYLPRQDGSTNGIITSYNVRGSHDGIGWVSVQGGTWGMNSNRKDTNQFAPSNQLYPFYRLIANGGGGEFASAADIELVSPARRRLRDSADGSLDDANSGTQRVPPMPVPRAPTPDRPSP